MKCTLGISRIRSTTEQVLTKDEITAEAAPLWGKATYDDKVWAHFVAFKTCDGQD